MFWILVWNILSFMHLSATFFPKNMLDIIYKSVSIQNWRIDYHSSFLYLRAKLKTRKILYKTEGEPKGVSINSFCISNNIPYTAFYDWFKKTQKKVVTVEVEGIPEELIQSDNTHEDATKDKPKRTSSHKGSIMVTIRTYEGLCIQKKGLDYQGLKTLV